jgi:hypothetical protein
VALTVTDAVAVLLVVTEVVADRRLETEKVVDNVGVPPVAVSDKVVEMVPVLLRLSETVREVVSLTDIVDCCVIDVVDESEPEKLKVYVAEFVALPVAVVEAVVDWLMLRITVSVWVAVDDIERDSVFDSACVIDCVALIVSDFEELIVAVNEIVLVPLTDNVPLRDAVTGPVADNDVVPLTNCDAVFVTEIECVLVGEPFVTVRVSVLVDDFVSEGVVLSDIVLDCVNDTVSEYVTLLVKLGVQLSLMESVDVNVLEEDPVMDSVAEKVTDVDCVSVPVTEPLLTVAVRVAEALALEERENDVSSVAEIVRDRVRENDNSCVIESDTESEADTVMALVADSDPEVVLVKSTVCEAVVDVVKLHESDAVAVAVKLSERVLVCVRVGYVSEYVGDTVGESDHVSEGEGDTDGSEYVSEGRVFVIVADTETVPEGTFEIVALSETVADIEMENVDEIVLLTAYVLVVVFDADADTEAKSENDVESDVLRVSEISALSVAD